MLLYIQRICKNIAKSQSLLVEVFINCCSVESITLHIFMEQLLTFQKFLKIKIIKK